LFVDISDTDFEGTDIDFCRHITTEAGVTAVPVSAFFQSNAPKNFIRFCFAKKDCILDEAASRLTAHFG
jgi:aspartate/methionine/tyrosine aminotransferase